MWGPREQVVSASRAVEFPTTVLDSAMDDELLRIMECPVAHVPLVQGGDWLYSTDPETRKKYPIRDGIPVMLIEESEAADPDEFERVMAETKQPRTEQ